MASAANYGAIHHKALTNNAIKPMGPVGFKLESEASKVTFLPPTFDYLANHYFSQVWSQSAAMQQTNFPFRQNCPFFHGSGDEKIDFHWVDDGRLERTFDALNLGLATLKFSRSFAEIVFLKMGQPRPLLSFIFGLFKQTSSQFLQQGPWWWSARSHSTQTIWVWIPLTSTVFSVKFVFEKERK